MQQGGKSSRLMACKPKGCMYLKVEESNKEEEDGVYGSVVKNCEVGADTSWV